MTKLEIIELQLALLDLEREYDIYFDEALLKKEKILSYPEWLELKMTEIYNEKE